MCTNATNKLIVNQQLILDPPEIFFGKYARKNDYEIYINEHEIIYIVETNDNTPIATFLKCVLKRYLKEENMKSRFNTCLKCGKFTYIPVHSNFTFGNVKEEPPALITENANSCNEPNNPFTNYIQKNEKQNLCKQKEWL
ncbi:1232_t:CDS:2 [Gigaspora margarita]|uniref:1232_t:CDS:1 n=1 Tax=Gigaspora margarita TaxID=4874 RepID=A0ABN7VUB8_GIGMA|nr:1232_t:CDS:2 [Gigaspora margarita]